MCVAFFTYQLDCILPVYETWCCVVSGPAMGKRAPARGRRPESYAPGECTGADGEHKQSAVTRLEIPHANEYTGRRKESDVYKIP